jgi:hypothetical protein
MQTGPRQVRQNLAIGGRDVRFASPDEYLGPAATSGSVTPRRVGSRHPDTSIGSITLSYRRHQENARRAA